MKKKLMSMLLCLVMVVSMTVIPAQAAYTPQNTMYADKLYEMGLFKGTGTNADGTPIYALDKQATRIEGLVMLVRLLGEEDEALAFTGTCPFTDVPNWAKKYAGYAYEKGYTKGTSATTFSDGPLYSNAFLTFVLRALGYSDTAGDFSYSTAFVKAADLHLILAGEYTDQSTPIYRDTCVQIAFNALLTHKKGTETKLVETLVKQGAVDADKATDCGIYDAFAVYGTTFDYGAYLDAKFDKSVLKNAKYYGLNENIDWIDNPTTDADHINNLLYCFLLGNYELNYSFKSEKDLWSFVGFMESRFCGDVCSSYPELLSAYSNGGIMQTMDGGYMGIGGCYYHIQVPDAAYSDEELFEQQQKGLEEALKISKRLHDSGKITDSMSDAEIVNVYYDYLRSLNVRYSTGPDGKNFGDFMKEDTLYSCLVKKQASCISCAATMGVLLNIEGIENQSLYCHFHGDRKDINHVVNRVVIDGVEMIVDWGNGIPLTPLEDAKSQLEFFDYSLNLARSRS